MILLTLMMERDTKLTARCRDPVSMNPNNNRYGDIGPLLSSLTCTYLLMTNMELDQTATSGLVRGLQHGVKSLELQLSVWGPDTFHIQTLEEYDGKGECGEVKMMCSNDIFANTAYTFREMKTWAERINWRVNDYGHYIVMKRKLIN